MAEHKVTVYSTPTCPYCVKVKEFLKEHHVKYTEIDVASDRAKAEEMIEKSGQMGVPVTEVDKTIIVGYDVPKLKKALGLK
ncbi:MAG TPA: glutaredoxin domain-containing protein [Candidatus Nanoarchaeia archaeon]|nr:glutaredoxin domain-containing protein [Candidatus Nanoarchaeia archaeon]